MPSEFLAMDTGMPDLSRYQKTEDKIAALQNYLYLLLENLRYILRNLDPTQNFNESALKEWADSLEVKTVVSNTVITNELYSEYGAIADLVVNELRTDYKRAQLWLQSDKSALDYIHIHDEDILFITATTDGTQSVQLERGGRLFYWTDGSMTQMTSQEATAWPVMVYVYHESTKASFRFQNVTMESGTVTRMPVLTLGAGSGSGTGSSGQKNGTGVIQKGLTGLSAVYRTSGGKEAGFQTDDSGYLDLLGVRKSTALDFSGWDGGTFTEKVDGEENAASYAVEFDESKRPVKITDSSGHATAITWEAAT